MTADNAATLTAKADADVIGLARRAEASGFDAVWVGDSVLAKPRFEPITTLAGVGAATDAVKLGTAVHLPPLRHAVNFAHATATADHTSGGRLVDPQADRPSRRWLAPGTVPAGDLRRWAW